MISLSSIIKTFEAEFLARADACLVAVHGAQHPIV